jgi:sugar lactone lactonase YvrE
MKTLTSTTLLDKLVFPECPRWKNNRLWFSNIFAEQVISIDVQGKIDKILNIPSIGIAWLPDNSLVFIEQNKVNQRVLQYKNGSISLYSDNLNKLSPFMFNDLVISSSGFAYTGNTGCNVESTEEWGKLSPAPIALIKSDGSAQIVANDLLGPNGMAINADNKNLIVAEPNAHRLTSFDILEDGSLINRKLFAQLEKHYKPDGICIDEEGAIWAAVGTECIRVKEGGKITHIIKTVGKATLACMLGGTNRTTLFICTKDFSAFAAEDFKKTKSGRIEVVEVDTPPGSGMP